MDNRDAARTVFAIASLLEVQGANPYRIRAYRRAAVNMLRLPRPAGGLATEAGELAVPWLGKRLRRKLGELVTQGRMQFHDELLDTFPAPYRALMTVPGIGPVTAGRLLAAGIQDVEGVAAAARAGRLRRLNGIGMVRERQLGEAANALLPLARAA